MQSNSYQLSNQKQSRALIFSGFKKRQVIVIKQLDGTKCTFRRCSMHLEKSWPAVKNHCKKLKKCREKQHTIQYSAEQSLGYIFMLGCTNKYSVTMLQKINFPVFRLQKRILFAPKKDVKDQTEPRRVQRDSDQSRRLKLLGKKLQYNFFSLEKEKLKDSVICPGM